MGAHRDLPFLSYRSKALIAAAKINVSITSICGIAKDWVNEYAEANIGNRSDLVSLYAGPVLESLVDQFRNILSGGESLP